MELNNYERLSGPLVVSRTDIGVIARVDESGAPVQVYEILMAKKDTLIVRVKGAHRSSMPKKIDLPISWTPDGHEVAGAKYQFFKNKGIEIAPKSGKVKKTGPKREGPTKLDRCRQIWRDHPAADKATLMGRFIGDAGCTKMGANTYYLLIKKEMEVKA